MNNRVVITGLSGNIGRILYEGLGDRWAISGIDIRESEEMPVTFADISDSESITGVFDGAYAVIHLAANAYAGAEWDKIAGPNITGTRNVFEAAREAGVRKVIFASSNHVTGLYEEDEPYRSIVSGRYEGLDHSGISLIDHTTPVRPDGCYAAGKIFGESLGRYYADRYGMQVICIRIGSVNRQNRPLDIRQYATLFMHNDLISMIDRCLENDSLNYEIFYGVSDNTWKFWDTVHIRECLGWEPEENAEQFRRNSIS